MVIWGMVYYCLNLTTLWFFFYEWMGFHGTPWDWNGNHMDSSRGFHPVASGSCYKNSAVKGRRIWRCSSGIQWTPNVFPLLWLVKNHWKTIHCFIWDYLGEHKPAMSAFFPPCPGTTWTGRRIFPAPQLSCGRRRVCSLWPWRGLTLDC